MVTDAAMLWALGLAGLCGFAVALRYRAPMLVAVSLLGGPLLFVVSLWMGRSALAAVLVAVVGLFVLQLAYFLGIVSHYLARGIVTKDERPAGVLPVIGSSRRPR